MRTRFDQFSKHVIEGSLGASCDVKTELEVVSGVQKIDAYVVPRAESDEARDPAGFLGRMAARPCLIEAFHDAPRIQQVRDCVLKQLALHAQQQREARRNDRPAPALPILWIVSGGDPVQVRHGFRLRPLPGWPPGCYTGPSALRLRLVLTAELPRERATLLMRLMGARTTLRHALADLRALPIDAWERTAAALWIQAIHLTLVTEGAEFLDEEVSVEVREAYEESQRRAREQGEEHALLRLVVRRLGRALQQHEEEVVREQLSTPAGREALETALLDPGQEALISRISRIHISSK